MSERSQTESMIDLPNQDPICDLNTNRPNTDANLALTDEFDDTAILFPYSPRPQPQPNEQFYCTVNEPKETRSKIGEVRAKLKLLGEEEEQEQLPPKQAAEVAAAARFISKVDIVVTDPAFEILSQVQPKPRLGSTSSPRDSLLDTSLHVSKSRSPKAQMHSAPRRTRVIRPPPLKLNQAQYFSEEVQSPLPQRTSSKGAPSFDIARAFEPARSTSQNATSPSQELGPKSPLSILTPESATTFQFDFSISSEPHLSRSASGASDDSHLPPTPPAGPTEDQIRRKIEAFAFEHGHHLRVGEDGTRKPLDSEQGDERQASEDLPILPSKQDRLAGPPVSPSFTTESAFSREDDAQASPGLRRKKSMFGWLQKKPEVEVDDLIDLYLTDEQRQEVKTVKRKASRGRLGLFRNRVMTDPLPGKAG